MIAAYNARRGVHWVEYDDGDEEWVDLRKERWEFLDPPIAAAAAPRPRGRPPKQEPVAEGEGALSLALLAAAAESADGPAPAAGPQLVSGPAAAPGIRPSSGAARSSSARPAGSLVRPASTPAAWRGSPLAPVAHASSDPLAPRPAGPQWLRPPPVMPPAAPAVIVLEAEPGPSLAGTPAIGSAAGTGVETAGGRGQSSAASSEARAADAAAPVEVKCEPSSA